jgi:hypothetical protein
MVDNAATKVARRSEIESDFNKRRQDVMMKYLSDKNELEAKMHADLAQISADKAAALNAVGLNRDGSDPRGRQQGLAV